MRSEAETAQNPEVKAKPPQRRGARPFVVLAVVALFFFGLFIGGILPRLSRAKTLDAASTNVKQGPVEVTVISVKNAPSETDITLPGNIQGLTEAVIYARADG